MDKSAATQGLLLPCFTYGKAQFALEQARKDRAGEVSEDKDAKSQAINKHSVKYAVASTVLPWVGGGILAHKQCKEVSSFYNLSERHDTTKDILAPNVTAIRNLAEIRQRENVPLPKARKLVEGKSQPYKPHLPMAMQKLLPQSGHNKETADIPEAKKHRAVHLPSILHKSPPKLGDTDEIADIPETKPHTAIHLPSILQKTSPKPESTSDTADVPEAKAHTAVHLPSILHKSLPKAVHLNAAVQANEGVPDVPEAKKHTAIPAVHLPSIMHKPSPKPVHIDEAAQEKTNVPEAKKHTAGSAVQQVKGMFKGKVPEQPVETPENKEPPNFGLFTNFMAADISAQQVQEEPLSGLVVPQAPTIIELPPAPAENQELKPEVLTGESLSGANKIGEGRMGKTKGKINGILKRSQKPKAKEPSKVFKAATPSPKVTEDSRRIQENIPLILISAEPPVTKDVALEAGKDTIVSGEGDQPNGVGQTIIEVPSGARVRSVSKETKVISKVPQVSHRVSLDQLVTPRNASVALDLEQDHAVQPKQVRKGLSLSADAMTPLKAAATGPYLEGDPVVSGPRQILSHEFLDDPVDQKRAMSPLPHTLESDKRAAAAVQIANALEPPADEPVKKTQSRRPRDISQDVRIVSPSGRVLALHAVDDDEIVRKAAQFPKSPHPSAVPGTWIVTASGTSGTTQGRTCEFCSPQTDHASSDG